MSNIKKSKFDAGKTLIRENDLSRKLFILNKGKVRVYKTYMGNKITLAVLGRGEIFGELSFFDAKPRSASVETLTDIEVDVIDGELLNEDIKALPKWVHLVFKSVATRFREVDQKMIVLQSMNNYKKKTQSGDATNESVYKDLLKKTKILKLIISEKGNSHTKDFYAKELLQTAGESFITGKSFISSLSDHNILTYSNFGVGHEYSINENALEGFEKFLEGNIGENTFTILSHQALSIMRNIISFINLDESAATPNKKIKVNPEAIDSLPGDKEKEAALGQVKKTKLLILESSGSFIRPLDFLDSFKHYSILKTFDHSEIDKFI